jgi:hypothetical protein
MNCCQFHTISFSIRIRNGRWPMPELNVPESKIANGLFNVRSL